MRINVKVITNAKEDKIEKIDENNYKIKIRAKPIHGEANKYLIKFLEEHFNSKVSFVSGEKSKTKVFEII